MSKHPLVLPASLERLGEQLHRPECVLPMPSGDVFVPDWEGGVTVIRRDGSQETWLGRSHNLELRPNGIAIAPDGAFLIANLGEAGGVWRLGHDGTISPFVTEVDGAPLPPANFVVTDRHDRTWISVSTRRTPRQEAWRPDLADGFIVLRDDHGSRIVADGLHYTNEVRPDPSGAWLYAVETFGRRVVRFPIKPAGELGPAEQVVTLGRGSFPDGFAFDEEGGLWVTSLVSNRLLRLADGEITTVLEDSDESFVDAAEVAFEAGQMNAVHLGKMPRTTLQQLTSVAFGGPDRQSVYLGSLHASCVYRFRASVRGAPADHWEFQAP
jgi:sugar lactone lactonase YvrE